MQIINKDFHDYYDSCIGYGGVDKTITYKRTMSEFDNKSQEFLDVENLILSKTNFNKNHDIYYNVKYNTNKFTYLFETGYVGFCGIIYPFIKCVRYDDINASHRYKIKYYYDAKSLLAYLKVIKYEDNAKYYYRRNRFDKHTIINQFKHIECIDLFFKLKNPIFCIAPIHTSLDSHISEKRKFIINPQLEKIQFYKIKDPFNTFQEIGMFISGVLGGVHPPTIEISDEVMKHKRGFDDWSFKNKVHKRKHNRKL